MKEYVSAILLVGVLLAVGGRLLYDRRFSAVTHLLFSLILLSALALPLLEVVDNLSVEALPLPELGDASAFDEEVGEAYAVGIRRALCTEFSLREDEVRVVLLDFSPDAMEKARVEIFLSGRAALGDRLGMEKYLREGGIANCEITVGF